MRTRIYIDGFNLYYGCLRNTGFRWLNLSDFCRRYFPPEKNKIDLIKYFTAKVSARPGDEDAPNRQQIYLRALRTLDDVEIHFGHFLSHPTWMPAHIPERAEQIHANGAQIFSRVLKTEEKGSDVNLASHLLADAFRDKFDVAVVISNDSDLLTPIKIVRNEIGKNVGVLNPQKRRPSRVLQNETDFFWNIRKGVLRDSQFTSELRDTTGMFHRPATW